MHFCSALGFALFQCSLVCTFSVLFGLHFSSAPGFALFQCSLFVGTCSVLLVCLHFFSAPGFALCYSAVGFALFQCSLLVFSHPCLLALFQCSWVCTLLQCSLVCTCSVLLASFFPSLFACTFSVLLGLHFTTVLFGLHLFSAPCQFFSIPVVCWHFFSAPCLFALVSVLLVFFALVSVLLVCLHLFQCSSLQMHILSAFQGLQGALVESSPACTSSVHHRTLSCVPFLCNCPLLWPALKLQDMTMTTPRFAMLRRRRQTKQKRRMMFKSLVYFGVLQNQPRSILAKFCMLSGLHRFSFHDTRKTQIVKVGVKDSFNCTETKPEGLKHVAVFNANRKTALDTFTRVYVKSYFHVNLQQNEPTNLENVSAVSRQRDFRVSEAVVAFKFFRVVGFKVFFRDFEPHTQHMCSKPFAILTCYIIYFCQPSTKQLSLQCIMPPSTKTTLSLQCIIPHSRLTASKLVLWHWASVFMIRSLHPFVPLS